MGTEFDDNWTTQVRKGVIELCVLNALSGGRLYGYDIVRQLRDLDGLFIAEGTVYPF
jgi:PadR family transcriptional regulator, regulatory protein PadR